MKSLFDKTKIGNLTLKNRFIRSATHDRIADEYGHITEALFDKYEALAKGGVGTIITGCLAVSEAEYLAPKLLGIYNDSFIDEYKELTAMVHKYNANIISQLGSIGLNSYSSKIPGKVLWVSSIIKELGDKITVAKEMTLDDINFLQDSFAEAAFRAKKSGFDGVQIHAGHETLLNQFLNPFYNRRTDKYGGNIENRSNMIIEVYNKIRAKVGPEYPIFIKINCEDFMDQGMTFEECKYVCKKLAELGINAVEITGGGSSSRPNEGYSRTLTKGQTPYFLEQTTEIKQLINIPVFAVGGYRDIETMTKILNENNIDCFALCRAFIYESDLINRWQSGDLEPAKCISCNGCLKSDSTCVFKKKAANV